MRSSHVAIVCPECETRTLLKPNEISDALIRHNDYFHDGDAVASVAGGHVDRLAADGGDAR